MNPENLHNGYTPTQVKDWLQGGGTWSQAALSYIEQLEGDYTGASAMSPEELAREFHERYERLAPEHSYETRPESAVPWEDVPEHNKLLMIETCRPIADRIEQLESELRFVSECWGSVDTPCEQPAWFVEGSS